MNEIERYLHTNLYSGR